MKLLASIFITACLFGPDAFAAEKPPHPMGWKSSPHGVKTDAQIEQHPMFKAAPLPKSASVAQYYYATTQDDEGACVAFSGVEEFDAVHQKLYGVHMRLSPQDAYQQCLVMDGSWPNDNGTFGGTLLKVFKNSGVLPERLWPWGTPLNKLAPNTPQNKAERAKYQTLKSYAVPNNDGGFATRQCIANLKIGVLQGRFWFNNQFDCRQVACKTKNEKGQVVTVNRFVIAMPNGPIAGGHEVVDVSYDDDMVFPTGEVGGVEFHNHWSTNRNPWGDVRGCAWMPAKTAFDPKRSEDRHTFEVVKKAE